jgi:hypothetical protein
MRRDTLLALGLVIFLLAALAAKSMLVSMPPVRSAPGEFDAARAKARLAFVLGDQRPHPVDSAADDLVRARLVASLRGIGLEPIVRDQMVCNDFQRARLVACARVRNVIAVVGPPRGKALLLSAHYDSVPVGPGASDDGIGVATLLEVGSILDERQLKRPVILLFNEGEELGLLGARAFLADPLSRNVDSLLNFEARGVNGPVTMFETSQPNGAAIAAYADSVRRPFASSLATDVARLLPNDTDVTTFKERGWLTLNSAIVGNETRYHSAGDNLEGLDARSLQDMGDEALALSSILSNGAPQAQSTQIFFDVGQRLFVHVPLAVGVVWLLVLLIAFGAIAWRRGAPLRGSGTAFGALAAGSLAGWIAVTIMGLLRTGTYWHAHPEISFVATYASVIFGALAVLTTVGRKVPTAGLRAAFWFVFVLLGAALALIAPGGIIYFLFPPTFVLLGMAAGTRNRLGEKIGALLGVLLLFLGWSELLGALEQLFSPGPLWIAAPVAAILITAVLIEAHGLVNGANHRALLIGSGIVALIAWLVAGTAPAYSQDHQQRFTIEHVTEFPTRRGSWSIVNDDARLPPAYSAWGDWHYGKRDFSQRERWLVRAPTAPGIEPAMIEQLESERYGLERAVRVRLHANGAQQITLIAPEEAHIRSAGVAGFVRPIGSADTSGKFTITCAGRSCDGAELTIELLSANPVVFTVVGARGGLPASAAPLVRARPRFARPQYTADETLAVTHVSL